LIPIAAGSWPDAHLLRRTRMPKGQQRGNREAKKPKQLKKPVPPGAPFIPTQAKTAVPAPGKKR
jgi:hypothetical protein